MAPENIVNLSLGLKKPVKTWTLSEELICDHSSYFRTAFQSRFRESSEKKISLDEELFSEKSVGYLIDWMYTGKLSCKGCCKFAKASKMHDCPWFALYVLADMLDMVSLARDTLSQIESCFEGRGFPSPEGIRYIYKNTLEDSPLREFVVEELMDRFLEKSTGMFEEDVEYWALVAASDLAFHCEVMEGIKQHSALLECDKAVACRFHYSLRPQKKKKRTLKIAC